MDIICTFKHSNLRQRRDPLKQSRNPALNTHVQNLTLGLTLCVLAGLQLKLVSLWNRAERQSLGLSSAEIKIFLPPTLNNIQGSQLFIRMNFQQKSNGDKQAKS